jgi:topoisomerase-4 subunit A
LLTKYAIKVVFKHDDGVSTLTARDLWYDDTVRRLNADKRGQYLGAFEGDDRILQLFSNGEFKVTGYDLSTHFDDDMVEIRKFDPDEIFSVVYIEGETQKMYLKRFCIETDIKMNTRFSFIGEHEAAKYLSHSIDVMPRLQLSYCVSDAGNSFPDDEINVEEFIGIKSFKAKGKRLSNREIESYQWLEPIEPEVPEVPEVQEKPEEPEDIEEPEFREEDPEQEKTGSEGVQMELF